jgi:1-deoxy-D-xylulose-5-phosphate synthase
MATLLDRIDSPADLRKLTGTELDQLVAEIRERLVEVISENGGHLASSLGAVELTVALHRVFNSPEDKIIWDVGHQSYAHKLLTGRRESFSTIRQYGGLSGFPAISESPHDAFSTGHSGTSISAALGMALARDLSRSSYHVVAVIGDGSLGSGLAFEAINNAGHLSKKLIVILNDNGMSISPSVGALSRLLNRVRLDTRYAQAKKTVQGAFTHLPFGESAWIFSKRMKKNFERVLLPNAFWEELGFTYLGPLDGHNIAEMESALIRARDRDTKPTVIHVITQKGKGYPEAENDVVKYHGVSPNGSHKSHTPSYSQVFGQTMSDLMKENKKIVVISAAMLDGTGLANVASQFPDRVFDVGICEQHAVTMAAGLATQGYIPVVAIYSTFLQRAYDQIIHDVCLQNLPVIFAIDRAGIVGEDGKTHQGAFDISSLRCIPNLAVASPADENELRNLMYSAICYHQPIAIRYPRGNGQSGGPISELHELPPGKGTVVRQGNDLTILAIGPCVYNALEAASILAREGIDCAVVNARFAKPLDSELILSEARKTRNILTVEENAICGGFGSAVTELLCKCDLIDTRIKCLGLPDSFIEHGPQELLRSLLNIDSEGIAQYIRTSFPELFSRSSLHIKEGA